MQIAFLWLMCFERVSLTEEDNDALIQFSKTDEYLRGFYADA